jgi:hypothetical protein
MSGKCGLDSVFSGRAKRPIASGRKLMKDKGGRGKAIFAGLTGGAILVLLLAFVAYCFLVHYVPSSEGFFRDGIDSIFRLGDHTKSNIILYGFGDHEHRNDSIYNQNKWINYNSTLP